MSSPASSGINFLLEVSTDSGSTYNIVGGLQAKDYQINGEVVDATSHGSNQWKQSIDGAGVSSFKVSGSGVHDGSALLNTLEDACLNRTSVYARLRDTTAAVSRTTYTGQWRVAQFKRSGKFNGAQDWSISLESNGTITVA